MLFSIGKSNNGSKGIKMHILRNWGDNVASIKNGAYVSRGGAVHRPNKMLREDWTVYDGNNGFSYIAQASLPNFMEITFRMAYEINTIRLLLYDLDKRSYGYYINVSSDGNSWYKIVDHSNGNRKSWQDIQFDKQFVKHVRIYGTSNTVKTGFHVVKFMAYFDYNTVSQKSEGSEPVTFV